MNQKPRADSKLKTLPEARQEQIAELLRAKTLAEVKRELAQDGLKTSTAALSEFLSWWSLRQQFSETESQVEELLNLLREEQPGISEEKLFEHGQKVFAFLAMKEGSAKDWKRVQDVRHRRLMLELERQKFQRETAELFLKFAEDKKAREIAASAGLSQNEKIEQLGQIMFGDLWSEGGTK